MSIAAGPSGGGPGSAIPQNTNLQFPAGGGTPMPQGQGLDLVSTLMNPNGTMSQQGLVQALQQLFQGPSQQQTDLVNQMIQAQFQPAAQQLQQQAQRLSGTLSGSAAARGLGQSSIGLGQQGLLGQNLMQQLGALQSGLSAQGLQQLLQMPMQQSGLLANLYGGLRGARLSHDADVTAARIRADAQRGGGGGLGQLAGMAAGSVFGPVGTAAGGYLAGQLFGGGQQAPTGLPDYAIMR